MAVVAAAVVAIDFAAKRFAAALTGMGEIAILDTLRLTIIHNDLLLGGLSLGPATLVVNCALIVLLVALMVVVARDLAAVDPSSPRMLGLLAGAAIGNGIDLLSTGAGAMDFLAVEHRAGSEIAFNLADVALLAGLALCARTTLRILFAWRAQRQLALAPALVMGARRALETEIARPVHAEGARARNTPADRGHGSDAVVGDMPPLPPEARR
jgi:lipoprotein signal peptidase